MKITLVLHDTIYSVESKFDDYNASEVKEIFSRILVTAGYSPSVIDDPDGGTFQYVADDEMVVKKEKNVD